MLSDFFDLGNSTTGNITKHGNWMQSPSAYGERDSHRDLIPAIDVEESEKAFRLTADLPGVKEEDINIEINDRTLSISGERTTERSSSSDEGRTQFNRTERHFGTFLRAFTLPENVNQDDISAEFENGVLFITLPKHAEKKSEGRRIQLNQSNKQKKH